MTTAMKKHAIFLLAAAALALAACAEKSGDEAPGYGRLSVRCGADLSLASRAATVPEGDAFALVLAGENYHGEWPTVADFAAQDTIFREGLYTASVAWGDPAAEGTGKPYYEGEASVEVIARRTVPVTIKARIANSLAVVTATEQFLRYFHDPQITVETGAGNLFAFDPAVTTLDDAVYVQAATSLKVEGTARKQSPDGKEEGPEVTFSTQTVAATAPRTRYVFEFDAPDAGSAILVIKLDDEPVETIVLDLEMNDAATTDTK